MGKLGVYDKQVRHFKGEILRLVLIVNLLLYHARPKERRLTMSGVCCVGINNLSF